jgi:hypothetical protein
MKKLKYIKLYEQYRINEEIFGLFGKKTEPKKVQTIEEDPIIVIGKEIYMELFGNKENSWITPEKLWFCFKNDNPGKDNTPDVTFKKLNEVFKLTTKDHFKETGEFDMGTYIFSGHINHNKIKEIFGNSTPFVHIENFLDLIFLAEYDPSYLDNMIKNVNKVSTEAQQLLDNLQNYKSSDTSIFDNLLKMYTQVYEILNGPGTRRYNWNPQRPQELSKPRKL